MGFIIGAIVAAGTVYNAVEQRSAAKDQAQKVAEQARLAAGQAAEQARGDALAQQTAVDRQNAQNLAKQREKDAAITDAAVPDVQVAATSDPVEAARRRTVRATFAAPEDPNQQGSIRL